MKKCVVIMNPQSGKKKHIKTFEGFYDIFRKYDYDAEIILTKSRGDACKIISVLSDDIDLVISAGGDGTLNEIVAGNMKRNKKLVIAPLPMGSTNDVGNMYGLSTNVYQSLEKILRGIKKKIDVCYINDRPFVYVACLGDYIDMAYATPRDLKEKYGRIAYLLYGIRRFRTKLNTYRIKYKVNGEEHQGNYSFIFISNSSYIAGQPDVYYDVKLDDNKFEVALAQVKNIGELSKLLVLISSVDVKTIPNITYYQTDHFEMDFESIPDTSWCLDGEEMEINTKHFVFRVEQDMKMMIPNEDTSKLFDE